MIVLFRVVFSVVSHLRKIAWCVCGFSSHVSNPSQNFHEILYPCHSPNNDISIILSSKIILNHWKVWNFFLYILPCRITLIWKKKFSFSNFQKLFMDLSKEVEVFSLIQDRTGRNHYSHLRFSRRRIQKYVLGARTIKKTTLDLYMTQNFLLKCFIYKIRTGKKCTGYQEQNLGPGGL